MPETCDRCNGQARIITSRFLQDSVYHYVIDARCDDCNRTWEISSTFTHASED